MEKVSVIRMSEEMKEKIKEKVKENPDLWPTGSQFIRSAINNFLHKESYHQTINVVKK